jgi:hypothetical protein
MNMLFSIHFTIGNVDDPGIFHMKHSSNWNGSFEQSFFIASKSVFNLAASFWKAFANADVEQPVGSLYLLDRLLGFGGGICS